MSEANPYEGPKSSVEVPAEPVGGSLQSALAGDFNWTIGGTISEAWQKQSGFKLTAWGGIIVYYIIIALVGAVLGFVVPESLAFVAQILMGLVVYPMVAGLIMMGVKRAAGQPADISLLFNYYSKAIPIFLLYLLMTILIMIGFVLLVVPGIYLTVAYALALPLMVEKNLGVWESLETSRKVVTKCWFRFFGLMLLMMLIIAISAIPLGIGLIWTLPMMLVVVGIVYRDIFGVNESTTAA